MGCVFEKLILEFFYENILSHHSHHQPSLKVGFENRLGAPSDRLWKS